jgi:hypothetical protein
MDVEDDQINVQQMAENIMGSTTFDGYKLSILDISAWVCENQVGWLTEVLHLPLSVSELGGPLVG